MEITPLHQAIEDNDAAEVPQLVQAGMDVNITTSNGHPALSRAANWYSLDRKKMEPGSACST